MDAKTEPTESTRRLPLFAMLGATALSMVGNVLTFVAIPWFVLQTTGSAAKVGLVGGAETLSYGGGRLLLASDAPYAVKPRAQGDGRRSA